MYTPFYPFLYSGLPPLPQAFLTLLGNITLALACFRLAISNGWTLEELDPRLLLDDGKTDSHDIFHPILSDALAVHCCLPVLSLSMNFHQEHSSLHPSSLVGPFKP